MTGEIEKYDNSSMESWQDLIEIVAEEITRIEGAEFSDRKLEKIIRAAELLISNYPIAQVAKTLKITKKEIKHWLVKYPSLSLAIAKARKNITLWRFEQISKQFDDAIQVSNDVLNAKPEPALDGDGNIIYDEFGMPVMAEPNAKLLGVKAQHARYILSLMLGNKLDININVKDESPVMKAKADALDYVVRRLIEERSSPEPKETVVIIQDGETKQRPLLQENGDPLYGEIGKLDINSDGAMCHICGKRFSNLGIHIRTGERLSNENYEAMFMLPPGTIKASVDEVNDYDG